MARMVTATTTIRSAFGTALSLRHTQRARLRQRPTRRERVLRPRWIGLLEGGALVARGETSGMLGALTFFLRQLHEWRATPARGRRHSDVPDLPLGGGGDRGKTRMGMGMGRAHDHRRHHLGRRTSSATVSAGDKTNLGQCRSEIQRDVRLMTPRAGTANLPLYGGRCRI